MTIMTASPPEAARPISISVPCVFWLTIAAAVPAKMIMKYVPSLQVALGAAALPWCMRRQVSFLSGPNFSPGGIVGSAEDRFLRSSTPIPGGPPKWRSQG